MNRDLMFSSGSCDWATPQEFYDELNMEFNFTLDPCADIYTAKCKKFFTEKENGLVQSWAGERVFMNPPYGPYVKHWVEKAWVESLDALVVGLIAARTDTRMWHRFIWDEVRNRFRPGIKCRFVKGRLIFGSDEYWKWVWEQEFMVVNGVKKKNKLYHQYGKKNPAPFPSAVIIFDRGKRL